MTPLETVLVIAAGAGLLAWVLRSFSGDRDETITGEAPRAPRPETGLPAPEDEEDEEDDDAGPHEVVAITSDGWSFLPDGHAVHLLPPGEEEDAAVPRPPAEGAPEPPRHPRTGRPVTGWRPGEHLSAGDLIGARVTRGAPDHDPWRLEALGRDRDFRAWRFETEEAARAALALVERRIVRPPLDEDGEPAPPGPEAFELARREQEEIERELASFQDEAPAEDEPR